MDVVMSWGEKRVGEVHAEKVCKMVEWLRFARAR